MTDKKRYQVSFDERLLKRVEKFKEENYYATTSGAIIELIRIGLETLKRGEDER